MAKKSEWQIKKVKCPEEKREAKLLLEWQKEKGKKVLKSIQCDNPKLSDLDNSDCQWSCWEKASKTKKKPKK